MNIFKKNWYSKINLRESFYSKLEITTKCLMLLLFPTPFTVAISLIWYYFLYKNDIYFNDKLEGIVTTAWIPTFGILYSLLAAIIISTVWTEYKAMRVAVKKYDFETFIDLKDEEMSPLVHALMLVLSGSIMAAFMGFKYPDVISGIMLISSTSYLFLLMFFVVREIDDPCSGIWIIKSIYPEWLAIEAKEYRKIRIEKARKAFQEQFKKMAE